MTTVVWLDSDNQCRKKKNAPREWEFLSLNLTPSTSCTWLNCERNNQTFGTEMSFWNILLSNTQNPMNVWMFSGPRTNLSSELPEKSHKNHETQQQKFLPTEICLKMDHCQKQKLHKFHPQFFYLLHLSKLWLRKHKLLKKGLCDITKGEASSPIVLQWSRDPSSWVSASLTHTRYINNDD